MAGRPNNDEFAALFNDELDEDEITPRSKDFIQESIEGKYTTHFSPEHASGTNTQGIKQRLTPEERQEIEKEIAENGWGNLCRCNQADFNDQDIQVRHNKALMVNLYFEYGGNWAKVFKDSRAVSRRAFAVYWRDDLLRSYIKALDPILMLEARGVVCKVMLESEDDKAALAAALAFLSAHDARTWDKGVRKQIVANKGSLESALFNRVISDDEIINGFIKDRLNKLPEDVRTALAESITTPQLKTAQVGLVNVTIHTADMTKLKDPFSNLEEPKESDDGDK